MKLPWRKHDKDQASEERDAALDHARGELLSTLDQLKVELDRIQYREAARERQQQRRAPGTA